MYFFEIIKPPNIVIIRLVEIFNATSLKFISQMLLLMLPETNSAARVWSFSRSFLRRSNSPIS